MSAIQKQALRAMSDRNIGAIFTTAFGYVFPEDVRTNDAKAAAVLTAIAQAAHVRSYAADLAARTSDAYSFDRYSSWTACAKALLADGWTVRQAEEILRSKHTRWAADASDKPYGRVTSRDLMAHVRQYRDSIARMLREELGL